MELWMIKGMAISLALTLVLESVVGAVWRIRTKTEWKWLVIVNVITNPLVVFTYYMVYLHPVVSLNMVTAVMEVAAVVTEALLYRKFAIKIKHPWLFSVCANAFSYFVGGLF